MRSLPPTVAAIVALTLTVILTIILAGCGGGDSTTPITPPPAGEVTVVGRVTAADNPALSFPSATVTLQPSGRTVRTDTHGGFTLAHVTAGHLILDVNPLSAPTYRAAEIFVDTQAGDVVHVTVSLLPVAVPLPTDIRISPLTQSVEVQSKVQFSAQIINADGPTALRPTWLSVGTAGTIDANGLFTTTHQGVSTIFAFSGPVYTTTTITATAPAGPVIFDVVIDPLQVPASGGPVVFTIPASDAQGVETVQVLIFPPSAATITRPAALVSGTAINGTFRASYQVPANTNPTNPDGSQPPQTYRVRVRAVDGSGQVTLSAIKNFTVLGLEAPPPPP
ncbi:MAG TPA: carboxypeptidase-like regulatory domain-containing protein [Armatimonadota bacterium]|jgi:hypothetical protein